MSWVWHREEFPNWFLYPRSVSLTKQLGPIAPRTLSKGAEFEAMLVHVPAALVEQVVKRWRKVFWWGSLSYTDIFGAVHKQRYRRKIRTLSQMGAAGEVDSVKFVSVANDTDGDESLDALDQDFPPLPPDVDNYVGHLGDIGWIVWLESQVPGTWEIALDGTPADNHARENPDGLKPYEEWAHYEMVERARQKSLN